MHVHRLLAHRPLNFCERITSRKRLLRVKVNYSFLFFFFFKKNLLSRHSVWDTVNTINGIFSLQYFFDSFANEREKIKKTNKATDQPTCSRRTGDDDQRTNSFDGIQLRLMMQVHLVWLPSYNIGIHHIHKDSLGFAWCHYCQSMLSVLHTLLNSNLSDSKLTEEKNDERKRANIGIRTHDHCAEDTYNASR